MNFLKIIIKADKIKASQTYERDISDLRWKVYFNESEKNKNENITAATMNFNWNKKKCLKNADIALMYHNKLKNLIIIIKKLINRCEKSINARNKIYKIYSDNQTSLKIIYIISLTLDQRKLQRI